MLPLEFVRQHPELLREGLRKRRDTRSLDELFRLIDQRNAAIASRDRLYALLKIQKEQVRILPIVGRAEQNKNIKQITQDIRQLDLSIDNLETRIQFILLTIPNLPHESVPEGDGEADDVVLRYWGEPPAFHFEPQPHWILGERLGMIDVPGGTRIAGSRFVTLKGMGARLERTLISFMLDTHTNEHGYTEILPPFLVKRPVLQGAGQLPKFEEQVYHCQEDDLFLNPTAEVPLVGLHSDSILATEMLPLRYVAWSSAFRREAGSASRHNRGLLRLHQFNKVELFQIVAAQDSYQTLKVMLGHAEAILRALELPYRVIECCTANLPFAATKSYDLEVWMPGQQNYVEIASISNCEAYQARRANIKVRTAQNHIEYPHTLNGSGLAVGRTMAALLELYQQADGSVVVPKVLRPYLGTSLLNSPR